MRGWRYSKNEKVKIVTRMNGAMKDKTANRKASAVTTTTAVVVRLGVGVYFAVSVWFCYEGGEPKRSGDEGCQRV